MNKHRYRIVFNQARGILMAVAETASSHSGGRPMGNSPAKGGGSRHRACLRPLAFALGTAFGLVAWPATAQIVANQNAPANQQPTVLVTANGLPQVNIQTPNSAGVSLNSYSQFDVQQNGAILNNSRLNTQTQLGGWVQGNPWLATGSAQVIVNQVHSNNPSLLNGYVEVAGQRADVVIANPSGIAVAGGGFINAAGVTLTTGQAQLNAGGSLSGFNVQGGNISIEGSGLNSSTTDYTAIISRTAQINANLWAQQLSVSTGTNQVAYGLNGTTTPGSGTGAAPRVALDVGLLGGMYANKIFLVGTESGVGMVNAGVISAGAGELTLSSNGWLQNTGQIQSAGTMQIGAAGTVTNSGQILSGDTLEVHSSGAITHSGDLRSGGNLNVSTTNALANHGTISAQGNVVLQAGTVTSASGATLASGSNSDGSLAASGDLIIAASGLVQLNGQTAAAGSESISATVIDLSHGRHSAQNIHLTANNGGINLANSQISAQQNFTADTQQTLNNDGGTLSATQIRIQAHDVSNIAGSLQQVGNTDLVLAVTGNIDNSQGLIAANSQHLTLSANNLTNIQGTINAQGDISATIGQALDNTAGTLASGGNLNLNAGILNSSGFLQAGGNGQIVAASLTNSGTVSAGNNLSLGSTGQINNSAIISAQGDLDINAASLVSTTGSRLAAGQAAGGGTSTAASGKLSVTTSGTLSAKGQNIARDDLVFAASTVDISGSQSSGANIGLAASQGDVTAAGATLATPGTLAVTANDNGAQSFSNDGAQTTANALQINTHNLSNVGGTLQQTGNGDLAIQLPGRFNNRNGIVISNGSNFALAASSLDNTDGTLGLAGTGLLALAVQGLTNNQGRILSNGSASLNVQSLANQGGTISAAQDLAVVSSGALDNGNGGQIVAGSNMALTADSLNNAQGSTTAQGTLSATVAQSLTNTQGLIAAKRNVTVNAGSLDNSGGMLASMTGDVAATSVGATINDGGSLEAGGNVNLNNGGLSNTLYAGSGGLISGQHVTLDTHGNAVSNASGTIAASLAATLSTGVLNNTGGLIQSGGDLTLSTNGHTLTNSNAADHAVTPGGIVSNGTMTLAAGDIDNRTGFIGANGPLTATADRLDNGSGGQIVGQSSLSLVASSVVNANGQIQTQGDLAFNLGAGSLDNTGGLLRSSGMLTIHTGTMINNATAGSDQGLQANDLNLSFSSLSNSQGQIVANHDGTLTSSGNLGNGNGLISAGRKLSVQDNAATPKLVIANNGGTLIAGNDLAVRAASYSGSGAVLSLNDLVLNLFGNLDNSGRIIANHDATLNVGGVVTNSGDITAANTLNLASASLTNQKDGEFSATNTNVSVANTLTNYGLIDGQNTYLKATTLNNLGTGRIYGDYLAIQAGTLSNDARNGVAGTIAARSRLDLGIGTLNNSNGALIYSGGDMSIGGNLDANRRAAGSALTLNNSGAQIQAQGNLGITADTITNSNPNFQATLTPGISGPTLTDFYTARGYIPVSDVGWSSTAVVNYQDSGYHQQYGNHWVVVKKSDPYSDPIYQAYFEAAQVAVERTQYWDHFQSPYNQCTFGDCGYKPLWPDYGINDPVWQLFGVAPPTMAGGSFTDTYPLGPVIGYTNSTDIETGALIRTPIYGEPTPAQISTWIAQSQPYANLLGVLQTFWKNVLNTSETYVNSYVTYAETTPQVTVTSSTPGQITAGGSMTLNARQALTNDKSQIIAGGAINITGQDVSNILASLPGTVERSGTTYTFGGNQYHGTEFFQNPYNVSYPVTLGSPIAVVQANQAPGGSYSVATLTLGGTGTNTGTAGGASGTVNTASIGGSPSTVTLAEAGLVQSILAAGGTANNGILTVPLSHPSGQVSQARFATPSLTLPTASLYQLEPASSPYLVETDARFANYQQWLSSDYLLQALSIDPATMQQRIGDAFYERQLINQQVAQLTGRRYLGNYTSDDAQYRALMDNGVTFARQYDLRPGVALTAEQVAQLTSDIVWLVSQTVTLPDGSQRAVLVPQVYALVKPGDLDGSGTLIAGKRIDLNLSGNLTNSGTLSGQDIVSVRAQDIQNLTGRISGDAVSLHAANDLNNLGGRIDGISSLIARAGHDLNIQSSTRQGSGQAGAGVFSSTAIDRVAGLYVTGEAGQLVASAGNNLTLTAGVVSSSGANSQTVLTAGRDLILDTVQTSDRSTLDYGGGNNARFGQAGDQGSRVTGGSVSILASNNVQAIAAQVAATDADGQLNVQAGNAITLQAGQRAADLEIHSHHESRGGFLGGGSSSDSTWTMNQDQALASSFSGAKVSTVSGSDTTVVGSQLAGSQSMALSAGGNLALMAAANRLEVGSEFKEKNGGFFGSKSSQSDNVSVTTAQGTQLMGGGIDTQSAGDTTLQAARISGSSLALSAGTLNGQTVNPNAQIRLDAAIESKSESHEKSSSDLLTQSMASKGEIKESLAYTTITLGGDSVASSDGNNAQALPPTTSLAPMLSATGGINVGASRLPDKQSSGSGSGGDGVPTVSVDLRQQAQQLATQPGLAYLGQLTQRNDVQWQTVQLASKNWDYSQSGLSPAGAALVAIAVAVATSGMGMEFLGTAGDAVLGGSAQAGLTATTTTTLAGMELSTTVVTATATGATATATATTTLGMAINAGFSTLASQAAVSLANNGGDLGQTLQELGSSNSIKNTLAAMVTAGVLNELGSSTMFSGQSGDGSLASSTSGLTTAQAPNALMSNLARNITNNLAGTVINSAITGKPLNEGALQSALSSAFITAGMVQGANSIGDAWVAGTLNDYTQALAHAVAGCLGGAATAGNGGGCAPGAIGAVVGELTAKYATESGMNASNALALAKMMSATAGLLVSGGEGTAVNVAATTGANAAENNYLSHQQNKDRYEARESCRPGNEAACEKAAQLDALDRERDAQFHADCDGALSTTTGCADATGDLYATLGTYAGAEARKAAAANKTSEETLAHKEELQSYLDLIKTANPEVKTRTQSEVRNPNNYDPDPYGVVNKNNTKDANLVMKFGSEALAIANVNENGNYAVITPWWARNGMRNDPSYATGLMLAHVDAAAQTKSAVEAKGDYVPIDRYILSYAPTNGFFSDLWGALLTKGGVESESVTGLRRQMEAIQKSGQAVNWVVHSRGGAEFVQAASGSSEPSLKNNSVVFHAGANNQIVTKLVMGSKNIGDVINEDNRYRDAPNDLVPQIIGLRALSSPLNFLGALIYGPCLSNTFCSLEQSPHTLPYQWGNLLKEPQP